MPGLLFYAKLLRSLEQQIPASLLPVPSQQAKRSSDYPKNSGCRTLAEQLGSASGAEASRTRMSVWSASENEGTAEPAGN